MDREEHRRLFDLLSVGRWFGSLPAELRHLILSRSRLSNCGKGQIITHEGGEPPGLFVVIDGRVEVVKHARTGDEALIYVGEQGFWSGDYALIMDCPAMVSVIARVKTRLLVLPRAEFERIVADEPRYLRDFARLAIGRTGAYLGAFALLASQAPETRLRGQLALLVRTKMDERQCSGPIDLPLSQSDLAAIVGVSRQTINPMLGRLAEEGLIEAGFRRIRVLEPRALQLDGVVAAPSARDRVSSSALGRRAVARAQGAA